MLLKSSLMVIVFVFSTLIVNPIAFSWDEVSVGKITGLDVAPSGNYGLRVYLDVPNASNCGFDRNGPQAGAGTWFYMEESDSNYKSYLALLTLAFAAQKSVALHATKDKGCHIGYIGVRR
ncbi:MAG: hypothetical protein HQK52_06035 [Oligoflexia bacterium]|nr:hypothetical protein [Oligoflexia bacterium]